MTKNLLHVLFLQLLAVLASEHTRSIIRTKASHQQLVIAVRSDGTFTADRSSYSHQDPPSANRHNDPFTLRQNYMLSSGHRRIGQHVAFFGAIPHVHLQLVASVGNLIWRALSLDEDEPMNLAEQALIWDKGSTEATILVLGLDIACVALCIVIAFFYKSHVTDNRKPYPNPLPSGWSLDQGQFKYGLCECTSDSNYCLTAWCCPLCRDADTYAAVGASSFWLVFIISWVLLCVANIGFWVLGNLCNDDSLLRMGPWVGLVLQSCYFSSLRQRLRIALGADGTECCMDCLCYHFCTCCIIAQNARHVDLASGAHVAFCCNLTYATDESSTTIVVGEPVPVQSPLVPSPDTASVEPPATN